MCFPTHRSHRHVHCAPSVEPGEGRYRWRHDQVLRAITAGVEWAKLFPLQVSDSLNQPGGQPRPAARTSAVVPTSDCKDEQPCCCNHQQQPQFPNPIVASTLRPDTGTGWRARCLPMEVRCGGLAARSLSRPFSLLGTDRAIRNTTKASEKASRWRWVKRGDPCRPASKLEFFFTHKCVECLCSTLNSCMNILK